LGLYEFLLSAEKPNAKPCGTQKFVSMALSMLPLSAIVDFDGLQPVHHNLCCIYTR